VDYPNTFLVVPDQVQQLQREHHTIHIPFFSDFYHPDMVGASDVVIGKTGYSTVAEVYWSEAHLGYFPRPDWPESAVMDAFIEKEAMGLKLSEIQVSPDHLMLTLERLLALPRLDRAGKNGAEQIAQFVVSALTA
jgi:UDP-N-acetylglucosamine:LPS N-acetylglucosamine transferase